MMPLRCSLRGRNSRGGTVTRAAGEGPREFDGRNDSRRRSKEA